MKVHISGLDFPGQMEGHHTNIKREPEELKPDGSVLHEPRYSIVPEKDTVISIKEECEPIQDNLFGDEDIKQEIIEFGEYELNSAENDSKDSEHRVDEFDNGHTDYLDVKPPLVAKELVIRLEKLDYSSLVKNLYSSQQCEHCGQTFVQQYRLARHRIRKHGSSETPVANWPIRSRMHSQNFHCDQCDKSYYLETNLAIHKSKVHGVGNTPPRDNAFVKHTCKHCSKQITGWTFLVYHLKHVHGESVDKSQIVPCPRCSKKFTSQEELAEHFCLKGLLREKARPFKCDLCDKAYLAKIHLEGHYSVHPEYHNVKCDQCSKGFYNQRELNTHKKSTHKAKEAYIECGTCKKSFKYRSNWLRHQEVHSDCEYCCEQCGKKYRTRNCLKSHIRDVHLHPTDEAFPCTICGKIMNGKRALKKHTERHGRERKFKCSFPPCEKMFPNGTNLRHHEQTHTKDYMYKCKFCDYGTISRGRIRLHEQQEHGHDRFTSEKDC
ncbi:hypothetical protein quinque_011544 [Culex quinquefasciatus]